MVYDRPFAKNMEPAVRPCGQCVDCRLNRSRMWAIRCVHEAKLHEENCVVTLTYADEHLPKGGSIVPEDAVTFMKDLRAREDYAAEKAGRPVRQIKTYGCAEYGCNDPRCGRAWCRHTMRPHYHIILFNYAFQDAKAYGGKAGYYMSELLEATWKKGGCQVMDLNFESAAYVARYVMKKLGGKDAEKYEADRLRQGRQQHPYGDKLREQSVCVSQKGIGKEWYTLNKYKIYSNDILYFNHQKIKPPTYYDKLYEIQHPNQFIKLKQKRKSQLNKYLDTLNTQYQAGNDTNNWTKRSRQRAHEACMEAKAELLKRTL